jgi:hypothetical protein
MSVEDAKWAGAFIVGMICGVMLSGAIVWIDTVAK